MLSEKVRVATVATYGNEYSRSIVAIDTIEEGESVWWYEPGCGEEETLYTWAQISQEPDPLRRSALKAYSYMLGIDTYASTDNPESDPSWFFNHSCDGNCWYSGDRQVVARRRIVPGEECTYDYALTETEASFHVGMRCKCGSSRCRGSLRFDDYRRPDFWSEYANHTTAHIASRAEECGWLDSRLHVRTIEFEGLPSGEHRGVFALAPVPAGEIIAVFGGKTLTTTDVVELECSRPGYPYLLQVGPGLWQIPSKVHSPDAPDYINHSCDANCGMADSTQVVALRDIEAGEQITLDYAVINDGSSEWDADNFVCRCGTSGCRKRVSSRDWTMKDVQDRYWPYFAPFVRLKISSVRPDLTAKAAEMAADGGVPQELQKLRIASPLKASEKSMSTTPAEVVSITVRAG